MSEDLPTGAPPAGYQTVTPYLLYENADRAVRFLCAAFGFVERSVTTGAAGRSHHELLLGDDGLVMLGQMGPDFRGPKSLGALPTSMVHVYVADVQALHANATIAGAELSDLETSPAGDHRFTATDPEGHVWVFAQRVASKPT